MIDKDLLNILACPNCKGAVKLKDESGIVCEKCMLLYEIQDGIPVMLVDKATKIESDK
ncbi:Trm112 family protein [Desulforhopalus sp. 52FAK]